MTKFLRNRKTKAIVIFFASVIFGIPVLLALNGVPYLLGVFYILVLISIMACMVMSIGLIAWFYSKISRM